MARRERRRRGTQYTGILRSDRPRTIEDRASAQTNAQTTGFRWRLVSFAMLVCLSGVMVLFFVSESFYVDSISVSGTRYMTRQEVYAFANVDQMHIFWVQPDVVRQNVMRYPTVADAQVSLGFAPNLISITVEEREPAIIWQQPDSEVWVDIQGNAISKREERSDLVRITTEERVLPPPSDDSPTIDTDIVFGVLQLHELRPDVGTWQYNSVDGLGFVNQNGWQVWFGVGTDMPEKLQIYEEMSSYIITRQISIEELSVKDPDAPYTSRQGR